MATAGGMGTASQSLDEMALLERDAHLARIADLRDRVAQGRGAVGLIHGAPGLGKTALWREACAQAQLAGVMVLSGRCGEQEQHSPFGALRECFSSVLNDQSDPLLVGAARHAIPALGLVSAEPGGSGMFAAVHGLYCLLANLAARGPLVLGLDDVHWVDQATARWLEYVVPRLPDLKVLLLITARDGELALHETVARAVSASAEIERIQPPALTKSAVIELLARAFGGSVDADLASACHRATGGNPLLLRALIADLRATDTAIGAKSGEAIESVAAANVAGLVRPRIKRLGDEAMQVARATAVIGDETELRRVAAVAELTVDTASRARDRLVRDDVLRRDSRLGFVHPLVRQAVYAEMDLGERSRLHRRAACELQAAGGRQVDVARHLLHVEPVGDAWVYERLLTGATDASQAGAPEVAIEMLQRALREPSPSDELCNALQALASAGARVGHRDTARWAREAVAAAHSALELGRTTLRMGQVLRLLGDLSLAQSVSTGALAEVAAVDHDLAVHIEACALMSAIHRRSGRPAVAQRLQHWMENPPSGGGAGQRAMRALVAWETLLQNGPAARALALIDSVLEECDWLAMAGPESWAFWLVAIVGFAGRPAQWLAWIDRAMDAARRGGSVIAFEVASYHRTLANLMLGNVLEAEADSLGALEIDTRYSWELVRGFRCGTAIGALIQRADFVAAERLAAELDVQLSGTELSWFDLPYLEFKGHLELARGRPERALNAFLALRDAMPAEWTSSSFVAWRPGAALAYRALGNIEPALDLAEKEVQLADEFGAPHLRGIALRTRGLVRGGEAGVGDIKHAVDLFEIAGTWLEHGWALHALGSLLRRQRRHIEAREPLHAALDYAARSGSEFLRLRAMDELHAAGARPRRMRRSGIEALTARELRVAQLAAQGCTNAEIAQLLFVSYKTVDTHLSHVYQKLGVPRAGLAEALAQVRASPSAMAGPEV